ncbi:MAG: hypothetical protein JNJ54_08300 [Myxococcaceae bacterium]|nr:hypothetical protein [Myxococcaceae bacterium]
MRHADLRELGREVDAATTPEDCERITANWEGLVQRRGKPSAKPSPPALSPACVPDEDWRRDQERTLRELGQLSAKDDLLNARWEADEPALSRAILKASSSAECTAVTRGVERLRKAIVGE